MDEVAEALSQLVQHRPARLATPMTETVWVGGVAISIAAAQLNKKPSAWWLNSLSLASRPKFNLLRKLLKNQRPDPGAPRPG